MANEDKKKVARKKQADLLQATVTEQDDNLRDIQPVADDTTVRLSVEIGDAAFSIPVPMPQRVKDALATVRVRNRTILTILDAKVGIDIIRKSGGKR